MSCSNDGRHGVGVQLASPSLACGVTKAVGYCLHRRASVRSTPPRRLLDEPEVFHVVEEDVVLHRPEDEADVVGVRGAGEVGGDHGVLAGIEADKLFQDEFLRRFDVPPGTWWKEKGPAGDTGGGTHER